MYDLGSAWKLREGSYWGRHFNLIELPSAGQVSQMWISKPVVLFYDMFAFDVPSDRGPLLRLATWKQCVALQNKPNMHLLSENNTQPDERVDKTASTFAKFDNGSICKQINQLYIKIQGWHLASQLLVNMCV